MGGRDDGEPDPSPGDVVGGPAPRSASREAHRDLVAGARRRRDTTLTVAALVPTALFLIMAVARSMHRLVAFGRDKLG